MSPADLARRAVACPRWKWMPGMKGVNADGITDRLMDWSEAGMSNPDITPDLADPATLGCVMALLDGAYGEWWAEPPASPNKRGRWAVYVWNGYLTRRIATGATRTEALIAALEAAP